MVTRLLDLVYDYVATNRHHLPEGQLIVYPMGAARIGHILRDMFLLGQIFPHRVKIVVTFRIVRSVNTLTFDELTKNMTVMFLDDLARDAADAQLLGEDLSTWWSATITGQMSGGIIDYKGCDYVVPKGSNFLTTQYCRRVVEMPGYQPDALRLSARMLEEGQAFDARIPIEGRKIVLLHVRDKTYLQNDAKNDYRACSIANYLQMMRHLIRQGYFVIRLGHPKMEPASSLPFAAEERAGVFDAAMIGGIFPELYYAERCEFIVHCHSGPGEYPLIFRKPSLGLNTPFNYKIVPMPREMITFRQYFRRGVRATLTDLLGCGLAPYPPETEIVASENDPDLLLGSTIEFLAFLKATDAIPAAGWERLYEDGPYARVRLLDEATRRHKAANIHEEFYRFNDYEPHRSVVSNAYLDYAGWF